MRFDIITIFPEFFVGPLDYGIIRRARQAGIVKVQIHDLREFTHDRHRTVDDRPFGGGQGMVLKPEPLFEAVESLLGATAGAPPHATEIVLLSAAGKLFHQRTAAGWAERERIVLLCGRYEGVDERVAEHLATKEISVGDFVLSGGELPAALVVDAVTRLLPGALGNEASAVEESFTGVEHAAPNRAQGSAGLPPPVSTGAILDCPHYTRPQEFRGWAVPEVLVSGNHDEVRRWRRRAALAKTLCNRPELLEPARLSEEDRRILAELHEKAKT